jgi:hypothetical protein
MSPGVSTTTAAAADIRQPTCHSRSGAIGAAWWHWNPHAANRFEAMKTKPFQHLSSSGPV